MRGHRCPRVCASAYGQARVYDGVYAGAWVRACVREHVYVSACMQAVCVRACMRARVCEGVDAYASMPARVCICTHACRRARVGGESDWVNKLFIPSQKGAESSPSHFCVCRSACLDSGSPSCRVYRRRRRHSDRRVSIRNILHNLVSPPPPRVSLTFAFIRTAPQRLVTVVGGRMDPLVSSVHSRGV